MTWTTGRQYRWAEPARGGATSESTLCTWMMAESVYRYYFSRGLPHHGAFAGGYLQTDLFEMMFSSKNRKGEFISGGVSGGYRWNVGDKWSLTTEIGIGYMTMK